MLPPVGYIDKDDQRVCKLNKSLYGLKQTSRQWFHKLSDCLIAYGFHLSTYDNSLFIMSSSTCFIDLVCYVNDIIIAGDNEPDIIKIKHLHHQFTIKKVRNSQVHTWH